MGNDCNARKDAIDPDLRMNLEKSASLRYIRTRDALKGGRTEVVQTYKKCRKGENMFYFDVVGLYPSGNDLGEYAVRYRKHIHATVEDIRDGTYIGLVKRRVTPNKKLHIPVLPENDNG